MNKKIIGIALIVILAIVFTEVISYLVNQNKLSILSQIRLLQHTSTLPNEMSTELAPIPKPSVPEFTVELIDSSYDVPTTYSIDPYTGKNVTHTGYHVECRTIEVTIKNQPFVSYYDTSRNWTINFYYNICIKGHYSEDWRELYRASDGYPTMWSDSEYTVISFQGDYSPTDGMEFTSQTIMTRFPSGGQVDFQVEAMIGYVHRTEPPWFPWQFTGETSGWSETRTITIDITPPTIFIMADGTVEGTDKIQRDGNTYTFTDNIYDSIVVERDNIVVDGAGYTLQGAGSGTGIELENRSNVSIKNVEIKAFNDGIWLKFSLNNTISGNNITTSNQWGIRLAGSSNNSVSGNTLINNGYGILVMTSDNNTISGYNITNNCRGLDFTASENNIVSGNYIANNEDGIHLENMNNSIIGNTIINNGDKGILLYGAGYNNIIGNNITKNRRGIVVSICYNNVIYHNNFVNNTFQIETDESNGIWDNGSEGNYWDDYTGVDADGDGIGDTAYVINENNQDNFPLMNQWIPPTQQSEPFPTTWIVVAIAIVAVVGVVFLVYFAKVKKTTGERNEQGR